MPFLNVEFYLANLACLRCDIETAEATRISVQIAHLLSFWRNFDW